MVLYQLYLNGTAEIVFQDYSEFDKSMFALDKVESFQLNHLLPG